MIVHKVLRKQDYNKSKKDKRTKKWKAKNTSK